VGRVLGDPAFRLLWAGQATSYIGDQFYLIALPWLVLQLTGDPLALGAVLATAGVPRAMLMLVGGAITDRFSPRRVMMASDVGRLLLAAALALMVAAGAVQLWSVYVFAFAFGCIAGFFMPAAGAIVPSLVRKDDLQAGNALMQGTAQLAAFVGPLLAGGLLALMATAGARGTQDLRGIALAFAIDAGTFLVSVLTLWWMGSVGGETSRGQGGPAGEDGAVRPSSGILREIGEGLRYVWRSSLLCLIVGMVAVMNLLFAGPLLVGIPVLAARRLPEGAAAFGLLMAGYAGGNVVGYVLAGVLPPSKHLGRLVPPIVAAFGVALGALGTLSSTPVDFLVLLALGVGNGYLALLLITWIQKHTPDTLLGRMMSLLLLANTGLIPLSQALAGALIGWSLSGLLLAAGALMLLVAALLSLSPALRAVEL
jgi:MFS family permease